MQDPTLALQHHWSWADNSKTKRARVFILAYATHFDKLSSPAILYGSRVTAIFTNWFHAFIDHKQISLLHRATIGHTPKVDLNLLSGHAIFQFLWFVSDDFYLLEILMTSVWACEKALFACVTREMRETWQACSGVGWFFHVPHVEHSRK